MIYFFLWLYLLTSRRDSIFLSLRLLMRALMLLVLPVLPFFVLIIFYESNLNLKYFLFFCGLNFFNPSPLRRHLFTLGGKGNFCFILYYYSHQPLRLEYLFFRAVHGTFFDKTFSQKSFSVSTDETVELLLCCLGFFLFLGL